MGWRVPTSYTANTNQWHNPANCYDGNLATYGWDYLYPLPFAGYYIEFNISEIQCNKIRFNAGNDNGYADKIDIDVYYNGSWHNVFYRGAFSTHVWVEVSLGGTYQVTKARVRFFTSQIFYRGQGWLYEFNFYDVVSEVAGWVDEPYAYDNNTGSAAYCVTPAISWTPFLIRELPEAIYSSVVKFYAQYQGTSGINTIDIDVYYNGAWHDVFEGSYMNQVWIEKELGDTYYVSKIAVRFFNNSSDTTTAYIQEMQFVEEAGVPKVTTNAATAVGDGKATLNGDITCIGGATCTARGFKYKEGIAGDEQDTSESGNFPIGIYSRDLTGLDPAKKYYFKAYATNTSGTGYGDWKSFGEDIEIPTVTTIAAGSVNYEQASLRGEITETGGEDPEERGFEYKIGGESIIRTIRETGSFGIGTYRLVLYGLDPNIEYHFRAYAKNSAGTGYGSWLDFTTEYTDPMVKTHNATNESETQVTGNGEIVSTGGKDCDEIGFEYGLSKVATWLKNEAGSYGVGFFDIVIGGLAANTEYWYRAYAKFSLGADINQLTFTSCGKYGVQFQVVGDKIYLVWREMDSLDYPQIWTGIMDLDGTNFVATKRTDTEVYNKYTPQLQVVGDKIYYVWREGREIWTATMDLDGTNFVATKRETNTTDTSYPQFQVVGSTIYYVWLEMDAVPKQQIWTATMGTDGSDWTATQRTTSAFNKYEVQFQVVEDTIYFLYTETEGVNRQIWTATMTTEGEDWVATKRTTSDATILNPQLEVIGDMIYFVFSEYDDIFTASMGIDGSNWTATQRTEFANNTGSPQLQVVENIIYYVFARQIVNSENYHLYSARMNINGTNWTHEEVTITEVQRYEPQFQIASGVFYCVWREITTAKSQIWTFRVGIYIGYGEWLKFITAAPGLPGDRPSGYKNDVCSDYSGYTYILNRSFTDDGAFYKSHFVLSTDLSGKKTLHTNKRLEDIFSYFFNKGMGTAKVYVKLNNEATWKEAGEISLTGEEEVIIKHLPVDYLAKHFLIKFVFENDFEFIGLITEAIPIGDRP